MTASKPRKAPASAPRATEPPAQPDPVEPQGPSPEEAAEQHTAHRLDLARRTGSSRSRGPGLASAAEPLDPDDTTQGRLPEQEVRNDQMLDPEAQLSEDELEPLELPEVEVPEGPTGPENGGGL